MTPPQHRNKAIGLPFSFGQAAAVPGVRWFDLDGVLVATVPNGEINAHGRWRETAVCGVFDPVFRQFVEPDAEAVDRVAAGRDVVEITAGEARRRASGRR